MTVKWFVNNDHTRRLPMGIRMGYLLSAVFALALFASAPRPGRAQQSLSAADPDAPLPLADPDGKYPESAKFVEAVGKALSNAVLGKLGARLLERCRKGSVLENDIVELSVRGGVGVDFEIEATSSHSPDPAHQIFRSIVLVVSGLIQLSMRSSVVRSRPFVA